MLKAKLVYYCYFQLQIQDLTLGGVDFVNGGGG